MRLPLLKPVTMVGRLSECILLSYRTPAESVRELTPPGFELLKRESNGRTWAFWNIVVCRVEKMRPAGTPAMLGVNYHHVAYRLVGSVQLADGRAQRGLYFLRSDADHRLLAWTGNTVSDFRFHPARIELLHDGPLLRAKVRSKDRLGDADLEIDTGQAPELVPGSVFESLDEARSFLKYEPMGLATDRAGRRARLAEVFRDDAAWEEQAVHVASARWEYLARTGQHDIVLELATRIAPIDYRWRLGRAEACQPAETAVAR